MYHSIIHKLRLQFKKRKAKITIGDIMQEQKKLTLQMTIFVLIIVVSFSLIILNEKSLPYITDRVDTKFKNYLEKNYETDISDFKITKSIYVDDIYQAKIFFKENENLYFTLTYQDKKITDTYKEDYQEGKTFLNNLSKNLEEELEKKYKYTFKVTSLNTLDSYNDQIRTFILKNNTFKNLKIYTLETSFNTDWVSNEITNKISSLYNNLKEDDITPKNYTFIITDKSDMTNYLKIKNLTPKIIEDNTTLEAIIDAIMKKENTEILKDNNISYEY